MKAKDQVVGDFLCACVTPNVVVSQQQNQDVRPVSLYNRNIASDEITDRLTAFPQHSHSGRLLQLEGGPHQCQLACPNLQALTERMTANDRRKDHTDSTTVLNNEV